MAQPHFHVYELGNKICLNEAKVTETEHEIKEIYDSKANGAQIRARIQFLEEGEKNTKYFLSLERSRQIESQLQH